jgi:hypothetical protein
VVRAAIDEVVRETGLARSMIMDLTIHHPDYVEARKLLVCKKLAGTASSHIARRLGWSTQLVKKYRDAGHSPKSAMPYPAWRARIIVQAICRKYGIEPDELGGHRRALGECVRRLIRKLEVNAKTASKILHISHEAATTAKDDVDWTPEPAKPLTAQQYKETLRQAREGTPEERRLANERLQAAISGLPMEFSGGSTAGDCVEAA